MLNTTEQGDARRWSCTSLHCPTSYCTVCNPACPHHTSVTGDKIFEGTGQHVAWATTFNRLSENESFMWTSCYPETSPDVTVPPAPTT